MKFIFYLILINVFTFWLFGFDKKRARKHLSRVPEWVLLACCWIGGCLGAYLGMRYYHHKTKKEKFVYGVPVIFGIHLFLVVIIIIMSISGCATM